MIRFVSALVLSMALLACVAKEGDSEHVGSSGAALTPTPIGPSTVSGIDVSEFQGGVDWSAQRAAGRMFGIARVGDGDYEDGLFDQAWADMKAAGVIRGAYQYFRAGTDPNLQADIMIKHVGKLGDGDLPCTIDIETLDGASAATLVAGAQAWVAKVEAATGRRPILYTGPYFWQDNVGSDAFAGYPLWIAHYDVSEPSLPAPWTAFEIWQYSDSSGTLDLDYFNGSLAELQAFASSGSAPTGSFRAPAEPPHNAPGTTSPAPGTASSPGAGAGADAPASGTNAGCQASPSSHASAGSFPLASLVVAALLASRRRRAS